MIQENTILSIQNVLLEAGALSLEQLELFFSDRPDGSQVSYYIKHLIQRNILKVSETDGLIEHRDSFRYDALTRQAMQRAFWPVAYINSDYVRYIYGTIQPNQFMFYREPPISTEEDRLREKVYDITVVDEIAQAINASIFFLENRLTEDEIRHINEGKINSRSKILVHHIAVVPDAALGEKLKPLGFNSYCTLDEAGRPTYARLD